MLFKTIKTKKTKIKFFYKFEVILRKNCKRSQHFELSPNEYEIKNAIILIRRVLKIVG